jgi:hypothetical protein
MKTTLNEIRKHHPCQDGWEKLLRYLNKTKPDDEPLPLLTVLESNGLEDTLWCFRAVESFDREKRLLAVAFAREVEHLMPEASKPALAVAERFANGLATEEELAQARSAAAAARSAAYAAYADVAAAYAYAREAAHAAAYAAYAAYAAAYAYAAASDAAYAADAAARYAAAAYAYAAAESEMLQKQVEILKQFLKETL